jgi:hypothetical protein
MGDPPTPLAHTHRRTRVPMGPPSPIDHQIHKKIETADPHSRKPSPR